MSLYDEELDHAAARLGVFVEGQALAQWPGGAVRYEGETPFGSRRWEIDSPHGPLRLAVSEPALASHPGDDLARILERGHWLDRLVEAAAEGDGLLVTADGKLFVWDATKDRGTRLLE